MYVTAHPLIFAPTLSFQIHYCYCSSANIFRGLTNTTGDQAIVGQLNAYELALLIPATLVQTINADLGPDPSYPWINVSWTLGAAVLVSVAGRLADIFGRRPFMLFGAFVAFCGTIIGATGQNIPQMIASGVIMGVGSGFQEMGFACILEFCPNKRRLRYSGEHS